MIMTYEGPQVGFGETYTSSDTDDTVVTRLAEAVAAQHASDVASKAKSELLAMMGHEIRTPINAIAGYVQLLELELYGPLTSAQRDALKRVERAQRHLLHLVTDVMKLVRMESGALDYEIVRVPIAEIVSDLRSMVEPQALAKSLTLTITGCDDCSVLADRDKLVQILLNLLSNAIKFTPDGGSITLDCPRRADGTDDPSVAFIRVRDTGSGIRREKQASVFDPFVQIDTTVRGRSAGAGLGLTISKRLAQGMDGALRVRGELGVGSSFTLALRRAVEGSTTK